MPDEKKSESKGRDVMRDQYLSGSGMFGPIGSDEIQRARYFIETMETYIKTSEAEEVKELESQAVTLSEEARDEFWQWHYPIHWEDIFGVRIRSAFVVQLCSHIEALLGDVARRVQIIERCAIKPNQIVGSTFEKHRLFLEHFGHFQKPGIDRWTEMGHVFRIRNVHIHSQGYAGKEFEDKKFAAFVEAIPGVDTRYEFIELKSGACSALLQIAESFESELLEEYRAYKARVLVIDQLTTIPVTVAPK